MGFFARPRLSNEQFVQHTDDILTLTGQTQIATATGLTLTDGAGGNIPVTASGASADFDVLTYCQGVISLKPSAASGGTNIYDLASPTTVTVGGLPDNSPISGLTVNCILKDILVPTLDPVLTNPSLSSFTILPSSLSYEVGTSISVTGTTVFNAGCINPQYTAASDCRSCGVSGYSYSNYGIPVFVTCGLPSHVYCFGAHVITSPNNTISSTINYSGGTQPKDSSGANYSTPLAAGNTSTASKIIQGIYPWYWGGSIAAPDISTSGCTQCLIDSYDGKCVASSTGSIIVNNYNVTGKYIWFAIPYASASKTSWQGCNNPSNNGVIPGGLFPAATSWCVGSPENCWGTPTSPVGHTTPICYKVYVSNYATNINYGMRFCN